MHALRRSLPHNILASDKYSDDTVSLQWIQPKLDGKRSFIADSFLRHPYIDILITTKIFHRVLFEKICSLEAENSLFQMC